MTVTNADEARRVPAGSLTTIVLPDGASNPVTAPQPDLTATLPIDGLSMQPVMSVLTDSRGGTIEQRSDELQRHYVELLTDMRVLTVERCDVDGNDALQLVVLHRQGPREVVNETWMIRKADSDLTQMYVAACDAVDYPSLANAFREAATSMRFAP